MGKGVANLPQFSQTSTWMVTHLSSSLSSWLNSWIGNLPTIRKLRSEIGWPLRKLFESKK